MPNKSRKTRQGEALAASAMNMPGLFTAEELLVKAGMGCRGLGIATVYRFLNEAVSDGKLHRYKCGKKTTYSSTIQNHCHFICLKCGDIRHFKVSDIGFIGNKISGSILQFQVDVSGVCARCSKEGKNR
mgnify:CR=1 FL=1